MPKVISLSVHDIVDLLTRRGHLDTRIFNQSSMQEGSRLHALYQKEQVGNYFSEYPLSYLYQAGDYFFHVSGKADGVIDNDGDYTVEEIKTTVADLNEFIRDHGEWHLSQAMFYADMLAKEKSLSSVTVVMTYLRQQNYREQKKIKKVFKAEELSAFMSQLILRYLEYEKKIERIKKERDESISLLSFPYPSFRPGQKEMMDFVDKACDEGREVYIEAPTGIGKTLSVLYPLILRFKEEKSDSIFYLTSKNSIKKVAMDALLKFQKQGGKIKSIEFTSKENICFNDKKGHCNPDECPFAKHYYDKLLEAIFDALATLDCFDRKTIEDFCIKRKMCPFQFQLDLSSYCDVLVCDYTYVYDLHDRLGLLDDEVHPKNTVLCVDECHNLPDRVRDMYSAEIYKEDLTKALAFTNAKEFAKVNQDLRSAISDWEQIEIDKENPLLAKEGVQILKLLPDDLMEDFHSFLTDSKEIMKKSPHLIEDEFLNYFYEINTFFALATLFDDEDEGKSYLAYLRVSNDHNSALSLKIANLDSRDIIRTKSHFFQASIFFSATLSPKEYYIDLLGGDINDLNNRLILPSPFPKENHRIYIENRLSLKYRDRDATLFSVYNYTRSAITSKSGNYFVFCPSFDYLDKLASFFEQEPLEGYDIYVQSRSMKERERDEFLSHFKPDQERGSVGLLVLGGVFSEGIDLVGDSLIGAIIISAALPQVNFERECLKDYYDKNVPASESGNLKGFSYAYTYPGINRMLQAGGRVIRSEKDIGFILYIDSRLRYNPYRELFASLYPEAITLVSNSQLKMSLRQFWKEKK